MAYEGCVCAFRSRLLGRPPADTLAGDGNARGGWVWCDKARNRRHQSGIGIDGGWSGKGGEGESKSTGLIRLSSIFTTSRDQSTFATLMGPWLITVICPLCHKILETDKDLLSYHVKEQRMDNSRLSLGRWQLPDTGNLLKGRLTYVGRHLFLAHSPIDSYTQITHEAEQGCIHPPELYIPWN